MDDGTRTHDDQIHNLGLYQLSYAHHGCYALCPARQLPALAAQFRLSRWRAWQDSNLQPPA